MQLWAKQSFGHPSGEHDAKPEIMSSAKRPGVLICAWHCVEKVMQPHAGRAQAALASICLQMTGQTSPKCAPHIPCPRPWMPPKETGNSEEFKCEEEKSKTPLVLEQVGSRSLPSRGFRPCPRSSSGSVFGEFTVNHGQVPIGFLSKLVPYSSLLCSRGKWGQECRETAFSQKPQLFGRERRHRGIYKLWVMPSPNTQGRRQQAPPRRQESPFFTFCTIFTF